MLIGFAALNPLCIMSQDIVYETMPELIDRGTTAFSRGDYSEAAAAFQKLQSIYSEEPEWQETRLSEKLMPLAGYAALRAGLYDQAIESLGTFLDQGNSAYSQEIFVKYTLALTLKKKGEYVKALSAFEEFRESAASTSQQGIALIHEADIHLKTSQPSVAIRLLQGVTESEVAIRVRTQARLRLLQEQIKQGEFNEAAKTLLKSPWHSDTMPELALLAFLAIESGDAFIKNELHDEALRAYQLVPSKDALLEKQAQKLAELKTVFEKRRRDVGMGGFMWTDFYEQVIQSAASQLEALQEAPDYTDQLLLRRGRASLLAGRPFESWLLFERLAHDSTSNYSEQGHLNWILAAKELHRFTAAISIAKDYLKRYPGSDSVDDALMLIASSLIESQQYDEAIQALTELSENAANHDYRVSSLYQRGQCYMRLGNYSVARADFDNVAFNASESMLAQRAELWSGISQFLESDFENALSTFNDLYAKTESRELKGEALYRSACCKYSLYSYDEAIKLLAEYSNQFAGHAREFEAQLLLGDSYFALNRFQEAISRYQTIPMDVPDLAHLAAIQTAFAYEQANQYEDAIRTLERRSRLERDPYNFTEIQLIYAEMQLNRGATNDALGALDLAIAQHGDNFNTENMLETIEQFVTLKKEDCTVLYKRALDQRKYRLAARFGLLRALDLRDNDLLFQSNEAFLELANEIPIEELPPECLAHIGLELVKLEFENGPRLLEILLDKYPNSNYAAFAYYGFAKSEEEAGRLGVALGWLNRIGTRDINSPIYLDTLQLEGSARMHLGEYAAAQATFETILSFRWASSKQKATSLLSLARLKDLQGHRKQAIAYCQRVFTLYPGITDAAAQAYLASAEYLVQIKETAKAIEILDEFLGRQEYRRTEQFKTAKDLYSRLNDAQGKEQKS